MKIWTGFYGLRPGSVAGFVHFSMNFVVLLKNGFLDIYETAVSLMAL